MHHAHPSMQDLFAQLGLPNEPHEIRAFIHRHRPLDLNIRLKDAPFWTPSQAALIQQGLSEDGEWALLVDTLSAQLREHPDATELAQS